MMIKINGSKFCIRQATEKDRPLLLSWYKEQGWDNRNLFTHELNHCVVMVAVDENDNPVSTVSYIYLEKVINLNSFVTDPKIRGNGLGRIFWDYILDQFDKNTNLYLKSVDPMTEKYKIGSGFSFVSTVHCRRYIGPLQLEYINKILQNTSDFKEDKNLHIVTINDTLNETSINSIIQYDKDYIHQEDCSKFLKVWLKHSQENNLVYTVYANDDSGRVMGYGSAFLCSAYIRIGPLFADNFNVFLRILQRLVSHKFSSFESQPEIYEFTVPSVNSKMIDFIISANLTFVKTLNRQFTKKVEDLNYEKIYCFTGHTGVPE